MNGANGQRAITVGPEGEMRAPLSSGLEDHGLMIIGIDASVCLNRKRIDDEDVQMKAALAAAQAEHGRKSE
jgi:hypothetical protein